MRESACLFEWRSQPEWHKDLMARSLLAEILGSGLATLVALDGSHYETPESLLKHFEQKKLVLAELPPSRTKASSSVP